MILPLLQGLKLTLKHFFSPSVTLQYPEEKWACRASMERPTRAHETPVRKDPMRCMHAVRHGLPC